MHKVFPVFLVKSRRYFGNRIFFIFNPREQLSNYNDYKAGYCPKASLLVFKTCRFWNLWEKYVILLCCTFLKQKNTDFHTEFFSYVSNRCSVLKVFLKSEVKTSVLEYRQMGLVHVLLWSYLWHTLNKLKNKKSDMHISHCCKLARCSYTNHSASGTCVNTNCNPKSKFWISSFCWCFHLWYGCDMTDNSQRVTFI